MALPPIDMGTVRGIVGGTLFLCFVALCAHTFSRRRRAALETFARIPLEDDEQPGESP